MYSWKKKGAQLHIMHETERKFVMEVQVLRTQVSIIKNKLFTGKP